jgi:hypothetical protein
MVIQHGSLLALKRTWLAATTIDDEEQSEFIPKLSGAVGWFNGGS